MNTLTLDVLSPSAQTAEPLALVHMARQAVLEQLQAFEIAPEVVRLANSDIAESHLLRDARTLIAEQGSNILRGTALGQYTLACKLARGLFHFLEERQHSTVRRQLIRVMGARFAYDVGLRED
ncbi:hypothetical protein [Derxia gummosa]|uniref:Uncharacterized protein n=1 Tax=Derxia gummosa DSM 723 TaxID=1121388 RepID=A0A8B6X812_9BURK|nr:hypothetical protein [Derxia gummosa]